MDPIEKLFGKMKYILGFILGSIELAVYDKKLDIERYCEVKKHVDVITNELNALLEVLKDIEELHGELWGEGYEDREDR